MYAKVDSVGHKITSTLYVEINFYKIKIGGPASHFSADFKDAYFTADSIATLVGQSECFLACERAHQRSVPSSLKLGSSSIFSATV